MGDRGRRRERLRGGLVRAWAGQIRASRARAVGVGLPGGGEAWGDVERPRGTVRMAVVGSCGGAGGSGDDKWRRGRGWARKTRKVAAARGRWRARLPSLARGGV